MPKVHISTEEFTRKVLALRGPEYTVLGDYKGGTSPINIRHSCGRTFRGIASNFINGIVNCPCEHKSKLLTDEEWRTELSSRKEDRYSALDRYSGTHTKIRVVCNACGYVWSVKPNSLFFGGSDSGQECPECGAGIRKVRPRKRTTESFGKIVEDLSRGEYRLIGEYVNDKTKVKIRHLSCGSEYEVRPNNFAQVGNRCPVCARKRKESRGCSAISEWLTQRGILFEKEFSPPGCRHRYPLRFDFWIPAESSAVEYDGEQHFRETSYPESRTAFVLTKSRDKAKNDFCRMNSVRLLRISYNDPRDIPSILQEFFRIEGSTTSPEGRTPQANGGGSEGRPEKGEDIV